MNGGNDGSESVDQFLARIASLKERRDGDEEGRPKRSEEELAQSRRERQARRLERARSLSPSKTGPLPSPTRNIDAQPVSSRSIEPPITLTPTSHSRYASEEQESFSTTTRPTPKPEASRPLPSPPARPSSTIPPTSTTPTTLARSGTLSWQQRPASRDASPIRSRPMSGFASIGRNVTRSESPQLGTSDTMSREQIAKSLNNRDPAWFRQTEDRGVGSAALRRNETTEETKPSFLSKSMRLPGLASERQQPSGGIIDVQAWSGGRSVVPDEEVSSSQADRSRSIPAVPDTMPANLTLPIKQVGLNESPTFDATPSLNRTSSILHAAGRASSPTKGLGGFVESAMMKRSDSVSKRWNVQAGGTLRRGDSVAGNRGSLQLSGPGTPASGHARTLSREPRLGREQMPSSPLNSSRPTSSHDKDTDQTIQSIPIPSVKEAQADDQPDDSLLARSPSKTMDPRRWSPTKASWLESALAKPPEPLKQTAARQDQPQWMIDRQNSRSGQVSKVTARPDTSLNASPVVSRAANFQQTGPKARRGPDDIVQKEFPVASRKIPEDDIHENDKLAKVSDPADHGLSDGATISDSILSTEQDAGSKPKVAPKPMRKNVDDNDQDPNDSKAVAASPPQSSAQSEIALPSKPPVIQSVEKKPPTIKPKPQTPPKSDFRAKLKSRQGDNAGYKADEPEFKAVFGKLKRTQTQNYVAPDELKDNIARGKAALNQSGGPVKTQKVDEFKQSILQKKDSMKTSQTSGKSTSSLPVVEKPETMVPEALARRTTLHKTASSQSSGVTTVKSSSVDLRPLEKMVAESKVSTPDSASISASPANDVRNDKIAISDGKPHEQVSLHPPKKSATIPTQHATARAEPTNLGDLEKTRSLPSPPPTTSSTSRPETSKLAARLNPALAGIITRTGSPGIASAAPSEEPFPAPVTTASRLGTRREAKGGENLNHMTKSRAKGPKRRAPKSDKTERHEVSSVQNTEPDALSTPDVRVESLTESLPKSDSISSVLELYEERGPESVKLKDHVSVEKKKPQRSQAQDVPAITQLPANNKQNSRPAVATKSPELRKVSNPPTSTKPASLTSGSKILVSQPFDIVADKPLEKVSQPVTEPPTTDLRSSLAPPKPLTPSKSKLNSPKPAQVMDEEGSLRVPLKPVSKPSGLGMGLTSISSKSSQGVQVLTPPPSAEPKNATIRATAHRTQDPRTDTDNVEVFLQSFFSAVPSKRDRAEFNTESYLSSRSTLPDKIKTTNIQIWEVDNGGKRTPLPPQQEHILYEDCMYLCIHAFERDAKSQPSEAYLWQGDGVGSAATEDAQLFCRKAARENNATRLEVLRQGKEHSRFFSALGGIVIIRRSKSSAFYMLCGRRHLGHIAFDEIDLSTSNLCSGFSYIISAKFGKLFLWKGQGSSADDVGAARLIGMDLGLTGEVEEVDEGEEPSAFWDVFPNSTTDRYVWSESWLSRDNHKCFPSTLYRVEHERPKSAGSLFGWRTSSPPKTTTKAIVESITPHCQRDLDPNNVYILDAYLDIFVFVPEKASSKAAELVSAQEIAMEMSMLLVSLEDRSLLPKVFVVFGEPPRDFQAAFRTWKSTSTPPIRKSTRCYALDDVRKALGY